MEKDRQSRLLTSTSSDKPKTLEEKYITPTLSYIIGRISEEKNSETKRKRNRLDLKIFGAKMIGSVHGVPKVCQNEMIVTSFGSEDSFSVLFSILDGHGPNGECITQLGPSVLPGMFQKMLSDRLATEIAISEGIERVFSDFNELVKSKSSKLKMGTSGSSLVTVLITEGRIFCSWVGDSRAMVGFKVNNDLHYEPLSIDHLPSLEAERNRILASGGTIRFSTDAAGNLYGPEKVWNPNLSDHQDNGFKVTRSIGDFAGKEVGVSCKPEVFEMRHQSALKFFVLASKAVWEVVSETEIGELVCSFFTSGDVKECARTILERANTRLFWKSSSFRDDMSVIVVYF